MPLANLVLTGGVRHAFEQNTEILVEHLADVGVRCETTTDIESGVRSLQSGRFDLLTVMALRWRMDNGAKYAKDRERYGFSMPDDCRHILLEFVRRGGGLFALHTACICFDDWPEWGRLLGGSWKWGQSHHPPPGPVRVALTPVAHPLTRDLDPFEIDDEVYGDLDLANDVQPLMTAAPTPGGDPQPVLWTRAYGDGRVVMDLLGHDHRSLGNPAHAMIIKRAAAWAAGATVG